MFNPSTSIILCINPNDPQHPHVQGRGNKFCTICGSQIVLKNRYIPLQKLGSGGFAIIYTVWDLKTQTERVLKVLLETSPKARELFKQEAEILQSLRHPAVPIVDPEGYFQLTGGNPPTRLLPCLVMEKINGQTLEDILASYPQGCPERMVMDWFGQAVDILRVLHKRQIIHRDLKPSNLMLRRETNQLVLIDFGGAKRLRSLLSWSQDSSTRLYSPGYSPPEQSQGRDVDRAADFYALGRTTIQLLTGKSPAELTDPVTGELHWRRLARVSPKFADLLEELVQEDVRQRPNNAARIQQRLDRSVPQSPQQSFQLVKPQIQIQWRQAAANITKRATTNQLTRNIYQRAQIISTNLTNSLVKTNRSLFKLIVQLGKFCIDQLGKFCIDTIKAMVLSAIASVVGTSTGFVLAYFTPLGVTVASFLAQHQLLQYPQITAEVEIIIFAAAGLATAWGLTIAGGFGQQKRNILSSLIGLCGYILGWLFWLAATPSAQFWGIAGLIVVSVAILTFGLGLRSSHRVHAFVTSIGTAIVFVSLVNLNLFPAVIYHLSLQPNWYDFWVYVAFFSFVSITLSFWLGISYYLVVPCLRWLGWR